MSKTRSCEGCDACCIAPGIKELDKPPAAPCRFLDGPAGKSCTVYGTPARPKTCRDFYCLWRLFDHVLPEWMDPKSCGFVVIHNAIDVFPAVVTVHPLPDQPDAWRTPWHETVFAELAHHWNCMVAVGQSPSHTVAVYAPNGSRVLKEDCTPEQWAVVIRDDGTVGLPDWTFGPDKRPLGARLFETRFDWKIKPIPEDRP